MDYVFMDRRNMEPPRRLDIAVDGCYEQPTCFNHTIDIGHGILMRVEVNIQPLLALRIRGGNRNLG